MDTLIFHKADRLPSLFSTWTVQKSFYKTQPWYTLAMAHNLIKAVDERPHFNINTIVHCASLSRNCTATERSKNVASLCSTVWIRITMPTESVLESPKLQVTPYSKLAVVVLMVSTLERSHCTYTVFSVYILFKTAVSNSFQDNESTEELQLLLFTWKFIGEWNCIWCFLFI